MKLRDYAERNSITYATAWRYFKMGKIPNAKQLPGGAIIITNGTEDWDKQEYNVIYARVGSSDRQLDLDNQATKLQQFCEANGWKVHEVVKEIASGLNEERPKLLNIFHEKKATRIIIENKDKLAVFGFNYIKHLLNNCEIIVANEYEVKQGLMEDFTTLLMEMSSKIYGKHYNRKAVKQILKNIKL